jgi:MFS family permease
VCKTGGVGIIVGVIVFGLLLIILIRGLLWLKRLVTRPFTKQEALQAYVNAKAARQPDGPGAGLRGKSGWRWLFWFLVACGLAYLLISGGILEKLGR